jgi:anti-sigma regulatory factor (Ser/Thr protein kinase)
LTPEQGRATGRRWILHGEPRETGRAAEWVAGLAREEHLSADLRFRVDLCLEEALANVRAHAFPADGPHDVVVRCHTSADWLELEVEDNGRPFDPLTVPLPPRPRRIEDAPPGGRGVGLIRHFAEECRYRREAGRNHLTLRWRRPREPAVGASPGH